jgi:glycosyltransferase involved in cell wall biosynthesis
MRHTVAALRVLVVLPFAPSPEGGAAARCARGLIQGLLARGVECDVLAARYDDEGPPDPPDGLPVELVRVENASRWRGRWNWLVNPVGELSGGPFAARVRACAQTADVVHFVEIRAATGLRNVRRPTVAQLDCATARDRRLRLSLEWEDLNWIQHVRAERWVARHADALLVSSAEVAEDLARKAPRERIAVAPLSLDPDHYRQRASLEQPLAGMIGTASWPPTANAVRRLLTRVWPRVLESRPGARLALAGVGMEQDSFPELATPAGVQWRGRVPSAPEFLRELGVLLYPLTSGSGVKVKVLEALALGLPVLTTSDGAEGLGGRGGVVVEDDDARLAQATVALLDDHAARVAAGELAHETFREHHSPRVAVAPVLDLYARLLA